MMTLVSLTHPSARPDWPSHGEAMKACQIRSGPDELLGLEALLAEHGASLRRLERYRCFLAARGTGGDGLDPLTHAARRSRATGPFRLAGFATFGFVLEIL